MTHLAVFSSWKVGTDHLFRSEGKVLDWIFKKDLLKREAIKRDLRFFRLLQKGYLVFQFWNMENCICFGENAHCSFRRITWLGFLKWSNNYQKQSCKFLHHLRKTRHVKSLSQSLVNLVLVKMPDTATVELLGPASLSDPIMIRKNPVNCRIT